MKRSGPIILALILLMLCACQRSGEQVRLGSGPAGGTFQPVAEGIAQAVGLSDQGIGFVIKPSGGSSINLENIAKGQLDLALVYAGDLHLATLEALVGEVSALENVKVIARFYGAAAQLVVPRGSVVKDLEDLRNRRIAIGGHGSGAVLAAKRYFRAVGLWEEIVPVYSGYALAMSHLQDGSVDAVWQLVGAPSPSLESAGQNLSLRFLDLSKAARDHAFFPKYPFYLSATVTAGTYSWQNSDLQTFQDSALLVASAEVSADLVYRLLEDILAEDAIDRLRRTHPVLARFSLEKAVPSPGMPLHPGAEKFWREKGLLRR